MKIKDSNNNTRECKNAALDNEFPGYIRVDYVSKIRKGHRYSEWIPTEEFLTNNPSFKKKLAKEAPKLVEDLGVVTKAGADNIKDISKDWKKDAFKGVPIWISRGKGEGQRRIVVKNNKNTIYIDKPWESKPDNTSQYVLSFNVAKNVKPTGNTLPGVETKKMIGELVDKAKRSS